MIPVFPKILMNLLVILYLCVSSNGRSGPVIKLRFGKIQGYVEKVDVEKTKREVSTFLGIPFGEVIQRFSAPVEVSPWKPEIKMAKHYGATCYSSNDTAFPGFPGAEMWNAPNKKDENCLNLNVWAPTVEYESSTDLLPVMVWIYGGSFYSGTSALEVYDGKFLSAYGQVVVVSFNYRLGPLGFMPPLGDDTPGNVGLLDQILALRWINQNINKFGGDPNRVTLFGESAGAASIGLLALSPQSRGLFSKVILQSASQTGSWASVSRQEALKRAKKLGSDLNCPKSLLNDEEVLLKCLRNRTAQEIFDASWAVSFEVFDFPFPPVYGTDFLPKDPKEMTREGKHMNVEVLAGYNTNEGFYFALYSVPGFNLNSSSLISKGDYLKGIDLSGLRTGELGRSATAFFYDDWEFPSNPARYRDAMDKIIGHFHVTCPVINAVKLHSSIFPFNNVFLYHFAYRISNNPWPKWMGVMHGYEIELVFGIPFLYPERYNDEDRQVSRRMIEAWINFAKHGNPGGGRDDSDQWPKYNPLSQSYVEISMMMDSFRSPTPHALECAFWDKYLPSLELASSDMDSMKAKWIVGFNRWSESMNEWDIAKSRKNNDVCRKARRNP